MSGFCTRCAAPLAPGTRFCTGCGAPVAVDAAPPISAAPVGQPTPFAGGCPGCGGDGATLAPTRIYCPDCRWLRPLTEGHRIRADAFMLAADAQAMAALARIEVLRTAANALTARVGRPWLEAAVNGIRLAPDQLPDIFLAAIEVARALGLPRLPELYVSGEQMWDCMTLGSEREQFIVLGSLLINLSGADLRYVLAREMGRVVAGHTLWKTVLQFMSGKQQTRSIMGGGALGMLNPAKLVESAIDAPLMAWARNAEITADRAGLIATGDHGAARRVTIQVALKSFPIYPRLNMAALDREVAAAAERPANLSEWTMSSTPYLARRLRLLDEFAAGDQLAGWRARIDYFRGREIAALKPPPDPDLVRLACVGCGTGLRVRRGDLEGKESAKVRCTNAACGKVLEISPRPPDQAQVRRVVPPKPAGLRVACPKCKGVLIAPADALDGKAAVNIRCPDKACGTVLTLRRDAAAPPAAPLAPKPEEMAE